MTVNGPIRFPHVIVLAKYSQIPKSRPKLSSNAIHHRDKMTCQYCGTPFERKKLNIDHVYPRSRGGKTVWENVVSSCIPCNSAKADKTTTEFGKEPLRKPTAPREVPVIMGIKVQHPTWRPFLNN